MRSAFINNLKYQAIILGLVLSQVATSHALSIRIITPPDKATVSKTVNIQASLVCNQSEKNQSYYNISALFDKYRSTYSPELLKALAWQESRWHQYTSKSEPYGSKNTNKSVDWGIMQINDKKPPINLNEWDLEKIKTDVEYCIKAGIASLDAKKRYLEIRKKLPDWSKFQQKYGCVGRTEQDILLRAYNGFGPKKNKPLNKSWDYPDAINKHLETKPWEAQVVIKLFVDKSKEDEKKLRLVDQYLYMWDTSSTSKDWHTIQTAGTATGSGKKYSAQISVKVDETEGQVYIFPDREAMVQGPDFGQAAVVKIEFNEQPALVKFLEGRMKVAAKPYKDQIKALMKSMEAGEEKKAVDLMEMFSPQVVEKKKKPEPYKMIVEFDALGEYRSRFVDKRFDPPKYSINDDGYMLEVYTAYDGEPAVQTREKKYHARFKINYQSSNPFDHVIKSVKPSIEIMALPAKWGGGTELPGNYISIKITNIRVSIIPEVK